MKNFLVTTLLLFLVVLMFASPTQAQQKNKMSGANLYYIHTLGPTDSVTFTASTSDTFPRAGSVWATNSSTFKIGGMSRVDLELIVKDTLSTDIYLERRLPAHNGTTAGAYATILTDSLINTTNAGKRQVYYIRSPETDLADGLEYEYRLRLAHRSTAGVTSAYIYVRMNWYP